MPNANKKWTVMVYLGADNNLSVDFLWNLKEMQEVDQVGPGDDKPVTVVAQYDPGQGIPTQRYVINQESLKAREKFFKGPNPPSSSRDGWLILDDDGIPTVSAIVKALVGDQLKEIARDCETEEGKLMAKLLTDSELQRKFGLKKRERLTRQQEDLLKEYFRTPEGLSKLRNSTLRDLVFGFELSRAKEERFREYQTTLEGSKDPLNRNTGDPMTLLEFILWGITYEAENYMVVLAGHGSGAVGDFLLKDENARDSLTLHELRDVFQLVKHQLGKKLAILGMDSCLMSMAEVYYQLVGSLGDSPDAVVQYLVGAEGFEPSAGWPYQRILDSLVRLIAASTATPETFAKDIVDKYVLYYFDYALAGLSVDLSACEIVENDKLAKAIGELGLILKAKLESRAGLDLVISVRHQAQCYKFDQYVDLVDFCDKLTDELAKLKERDYLSYKADPLNDLLNDLCGKVKEEVGKVVKNSSYVGPDCQESNGLSVYFPWNSAPKRFSEGYEQLEFTRRTNLTPNQIKVFRLPLEVTQPTDFTLHTNSEWYRFIETFTEKMRALIPTEGTEGKTLFSAASLHSPRTLYGGPSNDLYGGPSNDLYGGPSNDLGTGGSLKMAYCKPPSLVWKPHTPTKQGVRDVIDTQIRRVRGTRIIAGHPEVVPSSAKEEDKKALVEALGGTAEELNQTLTKVQALQALGKDQQSLIKQIKQDSREIEQLVAENAGVKETKIDPAMKQLVIRAMKQVLTEKAGVAPDKIIRKKNNRKTSRQRRPPSR